jgi:hypothetical protein
MRKVVIYDCRRPEKYPLFIEELRLQGINEFEVHPAIVLSHSVVESISESFKSVIKSAKENGDKNICIMEDDIMFSSPKSWGYFLNNKPEKFDIYIGGTYVMDNRIEYKAPVIKVNNYVGNHCIIVNESYYDMWLQTDSKKHCDTVHECGEFYLCFPFIALQRVGWSANNGTLVDYNHKIPKEYILR